MNGIDDIVVHYIYTNFTQETQDTIKFSLELLDEFNYTEHLDKLLEVVTSRDKLHIDDIHVGIYDIIKNAVVDIIIQHGITPRNDTKLYYLNNILSMLSIVVDTEDYKREMRIVFSDMEVDDKFIRLMQLCTTMTEIEVCDVIDEVDPKFIERLKLYFTEKDQSDEDDVEEPTDKIELVYHFSKMVDKTTLLGRLFLESGFKPNRPFKNYIPFIHNEFKQLRLEEIIESIYSLLILSKEYQGSGYQTFKENSYLLLSNDGDIHKFSEQIGKLDTLFMNYLKKIENEGNNHG